jgi:hypothetical protein
VENAVGKKMARHRDRLSPLDQEARDALNKEKT